MSQKTVVVIGATGVQGGSVIKAILADPKAKAAWKIRGTTRDPQSEKAKALTAQGVECVSADIGSKESLDKAFAGADAVFAVTNYWEKLDMQLEIQQGKNVADAAKSQNVKHLIWSGLLNVTKLSNGKYSDVFHFDSKAMVTDYIKEIGVPATIVLPGFYMSNIPGGMMREQDGAWTFALPVPDDTPIPLFDAADDTGKFVKAVLMSPEKTLGKEIFEATAYYTPAEIVDTFKKVFPNAGKTAKYAQLPADVFKNILMSTGLPEIGARELVENMLFMPEFGYYGKAPIEPNHAFLHEDEQPTTWEEFVRKAPAFSALN